MNKIKSYLLLFRLNKPFLAVPFAVTVTFLVCNDLPETRKLIGLVIAVVGGFMAGCVFNAITDIKIDKCNPRSKDRPLASGALSLKEAFCALAFAVMMLIIGTILIDWRYVFFLPIPVMLSLIYAFSKRFTWLCHIILGITNATCPVAAWGIFSGWFEIGQICFGAVVLLWTLGFELIYSSQDIEYDIKENMKSIPSVFGIKAAHRVSVLSHILMQMILIGLAYYLKSGVLFFIGICVSLVLLVYEHSLVKDDKVTNPELAFDLNQIYSLTLMAFAVADNVFCR